MAMRNAQETGIRSPFVSTTPNYRIAKDFSLSKVDPGIVVSIIGPESRFFRFNNIRDNLGLAHPLQYKWMDEYGIPLEIADPFKVVKVEKVWEDGRIEIVFEV